MKHIRITPYDPKWPLVFAAEAELIGQALQDNCVQVHHVGSTAVPGLAAKPKIDIVAVVRNGHAAVSALESAGYTYKGEWNIPFKFGFTKRGEYAVNLHVYEEGHPEIALNLMFRDHLRTRPEAMAAYAALKHNLLTDASAYERSATGFAYYTLRKSEFIKAVLKEAGFDLMRMLRCNDEAEWHAARHYRDTYFFKPLGIDDPYTWTFNHPDHAHLVWYQGVRIIGYMHVEFWADNRAAIRIIAIDEELRGQGMGSRFLNLAEKWFKTKGISRIHAHCRQSSLGFYRKNGYEPMPFDDPQGHGTDPHDTAMGKAITRSGSWQDADKEIDKSS